MEGEHQARNAVIATAALSLLTEDHFHRHHDPSGDNDQPKQNQGDLLNEGLRPALANLQCAARLERREHDHHVVSIVDSSHNEDSIEALVSCLKQRCIDKPIYAVFGTSQDKAAGKMLQILDEVPLRLILTQYQNNPRYFPIEQLIGLTSPQQRESLMIADNPVEACEKAWQLASETGGTVVVCGSFFLAAETRQWIHSHP
jgi:dihydrofolate synthase/folylpolyglutamate synthase